LYPRQVDNKVQEYNTGYCANDAKGYPQTGIVLHHRRHPGKVVGYAGCHHLLLYQYEEIYCPERKQCHGSKA